MSSKKPVVLAKNIRLPDGKIVENPHFFVITEISKDVEEIGGKMITHSKNGVSKRRTDKSEFIGFEPDEDSFITTGICKTTKKDVKKDEKGKGKLFGWFCS